MGSDPAPVDQRLGYLSPRQRILVAPLLALLLLGATLAIFIQEAQRHDAQLAIFTARRLTTLERYSSVLIGLSERHLALDDLLTDAAQLDREIVRTRSQAHLNAVRDALNGIAAIPDSEIDHRADHEEVTTLRYSLAQFTEDYRLSVTDAVATAMAHPRLAPNQIGPVNERFATLSRGYFQLLQAQRERLAADIASEESRSRINARLYAAAGMVGGGLLLYLALAWSRFLCGTPEIESDTRPRLDHQTEPGQRRNEALRAQEQCVQPHFAAKVVASGNISTIHAANAAGQAPQLRPLNDERSSHVAESMAPYDHDAATVSSVSDGEDAFGGDPSIIDLAVPAQVLQSDPIKLGRIARKFVTATRKDLERMEAALQRGDLVTLGDFGHRIKSPAQAMGAMGLADLCRGLEALREDGSAEQADATVRRMRDLLEQIERRIESNPRLAISF